MKMYTDLFEQIISAENLFAAWSVFRRDKRNKADVLHFEKDLEQHIFALHRDLKNKTYRHGSYTGFFIYDPKLRRIHKATVRDRVLHHAIFRVLNWIFEPTFIPTSFSCRVGKGTHRGVLEVERMLRKVSRNNTRPCFALKCDIKKFFDAVDHAVLLSILKKKINDPDTMWLLEEIIESFVGERADLFVRRGLPIGNLTSQLFANVYMNEFDQYMKRDLGVRHYARYTDDFMVISEDKTYLANLLEPIRQNLDERLGLELHPGKIEIRKYRHGIDFLGYVILPDHRKLRRRTLRRVERKLWEKVEMHKAGELPRENLDSTLQSYLGVLGHADTFQLRQNLCNEYWFWLNK